jgi:hypothetical protein
VLVGVVVLALTSLSAPSVAVAAPVGLYGGPDPRPGPDILYAPLATAPELTNAPGSPWTAAPILVSGTTAYRGGEFLYQDWIYDDRGAAGNALLRDSGPVRNGDATGGGNGGELLINPPFGTYSYPQDHAVYAENAADLLELRVRPLADATAFRVTLNTMTPASVTADAVAFTIALARCPAQVCPTTTHALPHSAQSRAPADAFLTVHGTTGEIVDTAFATLGSAAVSVSVDQARRQVEVRVPHSDWDPAGDTVRMTAGVGLWNHAGGAYLIPQTNSDATHPGGLAGLNAGSVGAFFNLAFRDTRGGHANSEPVNPTNTWLGAPPNNAFSDPTYWRDHAQATALKTGDLSAFHADVSFSKMLSVSPNDNSAIPQTGAMDRLFASHFQFDSGDGAGLGQGVDFGQGCGATSPNPCPPEYKGPVQPYSIYIPTGPAPANGYGMTLLPHSLSGSYNQYLGQENQSSYGQRDGHRTSIVITTEDRGPDDWYHNAGGADPFEAWADVAARFPLDPTFTDIGGYSMGGYATYKFTTMYPDLFAMAHPTVGPPAVGIWIPPNAPTGGVATNTNRMLASLRNIPFMIWNSVNDELVPYPGAQANANSELIPGGTALLQANSFDALSYRYQFWLFTMPPGMGHLGLAINDDFQPGADFLGTISVNRNPAHVTYVRNPTMDYPAYGTTADHAYWLSGIKLRGGSGPAPLGTVDVRSQGFGTGDPTATSTQVNPVPQQLPGAIPGCCLYTTQSKSWGQAPSTPVADVLDVDAQNISDVTVNPQRARVDCNVKVNVTSDGPVTVHLPACGRDVAFVPVGAPTGSLPTTAAELGVPLVPVALGTAAGLLALARRRRRRGAAA